MKRLRKLAAIFGLCLMAGWLSAQSCSPNSPCVGLSLVNPNSVPSPAVLWSCMGTSCTQAALNSAIAQQTQTNLCPAVQSVWHCTQFTQTKPTQAYNDPQPWGALLNYSLQGTTAGGVSTAASILTFQVPNAPPQPASISGVPAMVTSGNAGPQ